MGERGVKILHVFVAAMLFSAALTAPRTAAAQDACVWQFDPDTTVINGAYAQETASPGGIPYYRKMLPQTDAGACGAESVYLFFVNGRWTIGPTLGSSIDAWAVCNSDVYVESPFDCGANWETTAAGLDADAQVIEGPCPQWPCDAVFVVYESVEIGGECRGQYEASSLGPNVFERASATTGSGFHYFYFNPLSFRWQCGEQVDSDCDVAVDEMAAETGFHAISPLQWVEIEGQTPGQPFYVNCLVATTTSTTTTTTTSTSSTSTSTTIALPSVCGDPFDPAEQMAPTITTITASDALFALQAAVGLVACEACRCDVDSSGTTTASDALSVLAFAVGQPVLLDCPACS